MAFPQQAGRLPVVPPLELHLAAQVYATARQLERMRGLEELGCTLLHLDTTDQASIDAALKHVRWRVIGRRLRQRHSTTPLLQSGFCSCHGDCA